MNKTTVTQTRTTTLTNLYKKDLLEILRKVGIIPPAGEADIYMPVPGGGDWSHTNLHADDETPLVVTYEELHTKTE